MQAKRADKEADYDGRRHADEHKRRIGAEAAELGCDLLCVQALELACGGRSEVVQKPACDVDVEHHKQVVARHCNAAVDVPLAALRLKRLIHLHGAFLSGSAHRKLGQQHGDPQKHEEGKVHDDEGSASVLTRHVGEFPNVAQSYRTGSAEHQESKTASEPVSLHINTPLSE